MEAEKMEPEKKYPLVLITGGARSGKSTFAEELAVKSGRPVIYLATARVEDEEMRERVALHRERRPLSFKTLEEPFEPHRVLQGEENSDSFILLDCLTLLVSNLILAELDRSGATRDGEDIFADENILEAAGKKSLEYICNLSETARDCPAEVAVVTNEVGMGVVPNYPVGRVFRDYSGRANQIMASAADQVWFVVCGIPRRFK